MVWKILEESDSLLCLVNSFIILHNLSIFFCEDPSHTHLPGGWCHFWCFVWDKIPHLQICVYFIFPAEFTVEKQEFELLVLLHIYLGISHSPNKKHLEKSHHSVLRSCLVFKNLSSIPRIFQNDHFAEVHR